MRLIRIILPLLTFLLWNVTASAQYNPTDPPEPGVNFTLTTRSVPVGAAYTLTPTTTHAFGSNVRLYTTPNTGFVFERWEDEDGNILSEDREFNYSMPAKDIVLTARYVYNPSDLPEPGTPEFKETAKINIDMSPSGAGYLYHNGNHWYNFPLDFTIESDKEFEITAYPASKYKFTNWVVDGESLSEGSVLKYLFSQGEHTILANFEYDPDSPKEPGGEAFYRQLNVSINPENAGTVRFSGSNPIAEGERRNVYTYGNKYFTFINWTDESGNVVSEEADFYYTMPSRNVTLTANYSYNYDPDSPGEPGVPVPPGSIAENMVAYPRFGMYDDTHVIILCETEGSTIHYTLDGSDPDATSPVYTEPVYVESNLLVKAIAYKEGMDDSPIRSFKVSSYKAAAPVFTFENRKIVISSDTPGSVIRYTLDFSDPNEESEIYKTPVEPEENCRIKAYASKEGLTDSSISIYVYRRSEHTVDAPIFSLNEEGKLVITPAVEGSVTYYTLDGSEPSVESIEYTAPVALDGNGVLKAFSTHINYFDSPVAEYEITGFKVERPSMVFKNPLLTLSTTTSGAQIRYTLDGSMPDENATLYTDAIRFTGDSKVIARGFKTKYEPSDTISFTYVYNDYVLTTPTASFANKKLTLSCVDPEAKIHYTLDGTEPTADSPLYETPLALTEDCTVRFIATRQNFNNSAIGSFVFVLTNYRVETPSFSYDNVNKIMTISCATENAQIRYTTDGSVPEANTGYLYEGPFTINGNTTVTARAFKNEFFDSNQAVITINDQSVPMPTAIFESLHLKLECEDSDAQIYYTLDGTEPTADSPLYETPLALTEDCTVRFIATRNNFHNSPEGSYSFVRSYFSVAKPTFTYEREKNSVRIATETENAVIKYSVDGTEPSGSNGLVYNTPITVDGNMKILARAFKENYFDSETASLVIDDKKVATPTATFANRTVILHCADVKAEIHYTTDGTEPSAQSPVYVNPLSLKEDCTVRFIATLENFNTSDEAKFEFVYENYRVAAPVLSYNTSDRTVSVNCATDNTVIRYTTNGSEPDENSGNIYSQPVPAVGNLTFIAKAFRSDLFDSEASRLSITDQRVPTPTASFANHQLSLACEDPQAEIHYTIDGSEPISGSPLYESPLLLTNDCNIRYRAFRNNFHDSYENRFEFKLADYRVAPVEITKDFRNRTLFISHPNSLRVRIKLDGAEEVHSTPVTLNVTTAMRQLEAVALASDNNKYDSETTVEAILFHRTPKISYDGHTLTVSNGAEDPRKDVIEKYVAFNDEGSLYDNNDVSLDVNNFGIVKAHVESDVLFRSDDSEMTIDFFNTGNKAGVRNGHILSEVFGSWGDNENDYEYLYIVGEINNEDLRFLGNLPRLTTLHLSPATLAEGDYASVFTGSLIETIAFDEVKAGILKDMSELTNVFWNNNDMQMPEGILTEAGNPNILLWLTDAAYAPADAKNIVVHDDLEENLITDPNGPEVNGKSELISLIAGYPFGSYKPLSADKVEVTKNFSQLTEPGICRGWETIALPFAPTSIINEHAGEIQPFSLWDGNDNSSKPFWLYRATPSGWEEASSLEAGVPYIISMPNNPDYIEAFNLYGDVTFSAENVELGTEETLPAIEEWINGMNFEATFRKVSGNILSLNCDDSVKYGDELQGSVFLPGIPTLPFGGFLSATSTMKSVAVFDNWSGIILPVISNNGIMIEPIGNGSIEISSEVSTTVEIFTTTGLRVRSVDMRPGGKVIVNDLAKGIYIVAGSKIMVN